MKMAKWKFGFHYGYLDNPDFKEYIGECVKTDGKYTVRYGSRMIATFTGGNITDALDFFANKYDVGILWYKPVKESKPKTNGFGLDWNMRG